MSHIHTSRLPRSRRRVLTGGLGLGAVAAMLASGAVASAATPPAASAPATSTVTFSITQPPGSLIDVGFSAGLTAINNQTAVGSNMNEFEADFNGFSVIASGGHGASENTGSDIIIGQTTPGTPITGNALLPSGATLTAKVNGGSPVTIPSGAFSIPVGTSLGASQKNVTPSVVVSPKSVRAGALVTITGVAPAGSSKGAKLTLMSNAFPRARKVAGFPAISTRVTAAGTYTTTVRVPASTKPNTYGVTGRVGHHYLPVAALRVRG